MRETLLRPWGCYRRATHILRISMKITGNLLSQCKYIFIGIVLVLHVEYDNHPISMHTSGWRTVSLRQLCHRRPTLAKLWPNTGPMLAQRWPNPFTHWWLSLVGQVLAQHWANMLVKCCTSIGSTSALHRPNIGPTSAQHLPCIGPALALHRPSPGQMLDRCWPSTGPISNMFGQVLYQHWPNISPA